MTFDVRFFRFFRFSACSDSAILPILRFFRFSYFTNFYCPILRFFRFSYFTNFHSLILRLFRFSYCPILRFFRFSYFTSFHSLILWFFRFSYCPILRFFRFSYFTSFHSLILWFFRFSYCPILRFFRFSYLTNFHSLTLRFFRFSYFTNFYSPILHFSDSPILPIFIPRWYHKRDKHNVYSSFCKRHATWTRQTQCYTGAPNESVPHIICSPEESCWLAKIQVFRWAGWEILLLIEVLPGNYGLFSSISTRAGCRNSEDWVRLKKKKKKKLFPLPDRSHKHTTAGQSDCACGKKPVLSRFCRFCSVVSGSRDLKARGIPGWEINLISWLGNQPILSSWLGNFLCVLLGKRNRLCFPSNTEKHLKMPW